MPKSRAWAVSRGVAAECQRWDLKHIFSDF
jgi:hypothetical protein